MALVSPSASAGALLKVELPVLGTDASNGDVRFLVIGQLQGDRLWLNDQWHDLQLGTDLEGEPPPTPRPPPPVLGADGQPIVGITTEVIPTQFEMHGGSDAACEQSSRFRELSFLVNSLLDTVEFIEVAGGYNTRTCRSRIAAAFAATGLATRDTEAYPSGGSPRAPDTIVVRVFFRRVPAAEATAAASETTTKALSETQDDAMPAASGGSTAISGQASSPAAPGDDFVLVDGQVVSLVADGWFAVEVGSSRQVTVEVRSGRRSRLSLTANLYLLKSGLSTGYRNDRYQGIDLQASDQYRVTLLTGEDIDKLLGIELSIPIYLKTGLGYTLLAPLPTEKERDRPTLVASVRTYPFLDRYHFASDLIMSLRTESRIPWTVLATGYVGTDVARLKNQFTIPVGVGLRMFQAKVKQKTDDVPSDKTIRIPEAVLGPAAKIGINYKSGLLYAEAAGIVTPLYVSGSKTIVTFNVDVAAGYQLNELDTVVFNLITHDVRYPTSAGEAKVTASTLLVGYQRDLY
jgi:hypothetical protein